MKLDILLERAKQLTGFAAILYGFGFLVVRARMNVLGVWSSIPFLDTRYLEEGWLFCSLTLYNLARCSAPCFLALCVVWLIAHSAGWEIGAMARGERRTTWLHAGVVIALVVLLPHIADTALTVEATLLDDGTSAGHSGHYYEVLVYTAAAALGAWWLIRSPRLPQVFGWFVTLVAATVATVVLPTTHATHMRTRKFYFADVETVTLGPFVGVCLLDITSESLVMHVNHTNVVIPRTAVKQIVIRRATCATRK